MLSIHKRFLNSIDADPDRTALIDSQSTMSYGELGHRNFVIQQCLGALSLSPSSSIGICVTKNVQGVAAIFSIFLSEYACVPISEHWPINQIHAILEQLNLSVILVDDVTCHYFSESVSDKVRLLNVNQFAGPVAVPSPNQSPKSDNVAYQLFTSGSTGRAKGVEVSLENLSYVANSWGTLFALNRHKGHRHLQMAHYTFDVFYGDLIRALCFCGTLVLCQKRTMCSPQRLFNFITTNNISIAEFTPYILRRLVAYCESNQLMLLTLKILISGSDVWTWRDAEKVRKRLSTKARLFNTYGLTEASIDSLYYEYTPNHTINNLSDPVPIGRPMPGICVALLNDQRQRITQPEEAGQIAILGGTVATGYCTSVSNAASTYFDTILLDGKYQRALLTGDIAKYDNDGCLHMLGRCDDQIKLRGQRISLLWIEDVLNQHALVDNSMVAMDEDTDSEPILVAYIKSHAAQALFENTLRRYLSRFLPNYAIPKKIMLTDHIPINANYKVIRKPLVGNTVPLNRLDEREVTDQAQKYLTMLCRMLQCRSLNINDALLGLGFTPSLLKAHLSAFAIKHRKVDWGILEQCKTIQDLINLFSQGFITFDDDHFMLTDLSPSQRQA